MTVDELLDLAKSEIASADPDVRGRGLQRLLTVARNNESIRAEALPIFKSALESEEAPWAALNAARGIELIAGREDGQRAWRQLLDHPKVEVVAATAAVVDASHGMQLLQVLDRRAETAIQIPVVRALGRLKVAAAFDQIVRRLADRDLRPHAIEALGDLGDARAVEHLKPLLTDTTEAWPEDNHGPMLRVRDLAKAAIARLSAPAEAAPVHLAKAPMPPNGGPSKLQPKAPANVFAYLPFIAALVEVPWFGVLVFVGIVATGSTWLSDDNTRTLDLIAMIPAVSGLVLGVVALLRGGFKTTAETVWFVAGMLLCGLAMFSFGWEYLHPNVEPPPTKPGVVISL